MDGAEFATNVKNIKTRTGGVGQSRKDKC